MTAPSVARFPSGSLFPGVSERDLTITVHLAPARFTVAIGVDVPRVIDVSNGATEYVTFTAKETSGADLAGVVLQVSLGSYTAPGAWVGPDEVTYPATGQARVSLLVSDSLALAAGRYYGWIRFTDSPEVIPVRCSDAAITIR